MGLFADFVVGLLVLGAHDNRLSHLRVSRSLFSGLIVGDAEHTLIQHSTVIAKRLTTDQAGIAVFAYAWYQNRTRRRVWKRRHRRLQLPWTGTMVLADGRFRGTNDQDDGEFVGTYEVFRDVLVFTEEVEPGEEVLSVTFTVNSAAHHGHTDARN